MPAEREPEGEVGDRVWVFLPFSELFVHSITKSNGWGTIGFYLTFCALPCR